MDGSVEITSTNNIQKADSSTVVGYVQATQPSTVSDDERPLLPRQDKRRTAQGVQSLEARPPSPTNQNGLQLCSTSQRRLSVTRALAAVHRLNQELDGADLLSTVCVCCLTAVFMGRIVLRRILFARRRKGSTPRSLKIECQPA